MEKIGLITMWLARGERALDWPFKSSASAQARCNADEPLDAVVENFTQVVDVATRVEAK